MFKTKNICLSILTRFSDPSNKKSIFKIVLNTSQQVLNVSNNLPRRVLKFFLKTKI